MKLTRIFIASQFNAFSASVHTGPKTGEEKVAFFKLYWTQDDVMFLFVRFRWERCIQDAGDVAQLSNKHEVLAFTPGSNC